MTRSFSSGTPKAASVSQAALGVDDDAFESAEQAPPQRGLVRRSPGQQVMGREHERRAVPKEPDVELGRGEPLHVHDVRRRRRQAREPERVLGCLQRQPQPRAAEEPRRERVEELAAPVAVRRRHVAEAEARRHELHVGARAGQRRGKLVVVGRRERGWVGDDDAHARTLLRVLVRSWNLFHGNTVPPDRHSHLETMIRLAAADRPDVLCLQEVPLWALQRLPGWSGMTVRHVVTRRALLGARLGGAVTRLHNGFFRSALAGQANAILLAPGLEPLEHRSLRIDEGRVEPRWCHAVRLDGLAVGNLHATNDFRQPDVPAAEIVRAEAFVTEVAQGLPSVLAGDFNLRAEHLLELPGWSSLGPGIDHVLVRELEASPLSVWPPERRVHDGVGALGSRTRRGEDRVTAAEARALFPVLERLAYLNAGTFGPLARATVDAVEAELAEELANGRFGKAYFDRLLRLRAEAREAFAALVGVAPEQVSLTGSTTDGCNIVLAGLDLQPDDEIVTTREEHFGLLGPVYASGARVVVVDADPDAIRDAVTPRTQAPGALAGALDDRARPSGPRTARADGGAGAGRRRAVGGRDPRRGARAGLPDDLRAEVALRAGRHRRPRRRRSRDAAGRQAELLLPEGVRGDRRVRAGRGSSALRPRVGSPCRASPASSRRSSWRRSGASSGPPSRRRAAGSCSRRSWTSSRAERRSSPSAPTTRLRSSRGWQRPASSSATCRAPGSCALRAAGGRATRTSTGSRRRFVPRGATLPGVLRLAALLGTLATLATAGAASSASDGEPFFVGFSEDLPKDLGSGAVAPAAALGGSAFRLTTLWSPERTTLTAAERTKLDRATAAATGQRIVLAVYADAGSKAPQVAAARDAYCSYVRSVLSAYPSIRDVVIWNEPNKNLFWGPQATAPARYEELLARCHTVLHAAFPNVNVIGLALSSTGNDDAGSTSPGEFIRDVGDSYRANDRAGRIMDTVGHHPYATAASERPWRKHIASKTIAQGDWNKLMHNLFLAFDGTAQPIPGEEDVRIWYTESGYQTAVDQGKETAYTGTENVATIPDDAGGEPETPVPAETSAAPDQRTQALDAIRLAACQPYVAPTSTSCSPTRPRLEGWQSGPYWADLTPKGSAPAFAQAISQATSGSVDCGALKGGRPSADFMPPATPTGLTGTAATGPLRVELTWNAAADDQSPVSYRVFRDGGHVATTEATAWTHATVAPNTTYTYVVRAIDAAGNLGSASASVR